MFQHLQSCTQKLNELVDEVNLVDTVVAKTMVESMIHQAVKVKELLSISSSAQINAQIIENIKSVCKSAEDYAALEKELLLYKVDMESKINTEVSLATVNLKYENEVLRRQVNDITIEKETAVETFKSSSEYNQLVMNMPPERVASLSYFPTAVSHATANMEKQLDALHTEVSFYRQNQSVAADAATRAADLVQTTLVTELTEKISNLEQELEKSQEEASWQRNLDTLQNGSKSGTIMEHYVIDQINSLYKTTLIAERTGSDGKSLDIRLKSTEHDIAGIEVKNNKDNAKPEEYRTFEQVANKLCKENNITIFAFMQFTDNHKFVPIEIIDHISHKIIKLTIFRQDRLLIEANISNMITLILQLHARNLAGDHHDELDTHTNEYIMDTDNYFNISDAISTRMCDLSKELDQMNKIMRNKCDDIKRTRGIKRKVDKVKSNTVVPKSNIV